MSTTSLRLYRVDQLTGTRLLRDSVAVYETITGSRESLDLGETWAGLHVMLTGGDPPMPRHVALDEGLEWDDTSYENILMGGEPTPYEDGLSGARYLAPQAVRALAPRLAELTPEDFAERFDDDILEYLPNGWDAARARAELAAQFARLSEWFRAAASAGDGLLLYVS